MHNTSDSFHIDYTTNLVYFVVPLTNSEPAPQLAVTSLEANSTFTVLDYQLNYAYSLLQVRGVRHELVGWSREWSRTGCYVGVAAAVVGALAGE